MNVLRRAIWIAVGLGLLVVGWRFPAENAAPVRIGYLFGSSGEMPLWLALLAAFGCGLVLAALLCGYRLALAALALRRYRKSVSALEREVHALRNLPLDEGAAAAQQPYPPSPPPPAPAAAPAAPPGGAPAKGT